MNEYAERQRRLERDIQQYQGTNPWQLADLLSKTMKELYEIRKQERGKTGKLFPINRAIRERAIREKEWLETVLQHRLAVDFGAQHGWRLSQTDFGLRTLSRG